METQQHQHEKKLHTYSCYQSGLYVCDVAADTAKDAEAQCKEVVAQFQRHPVTEITAIRID